MSAKLEFYGHSAFGLTLGETKLLIDPFFTDNPLASTSWDKLGKVDYILLTHGHGDHVGDTIEIAKATGATVIANYEIVGWLESKGLEKLHPQHLGGGFHHPFGYLKFTIAHHGSGLPDGSYGGNPGGLLIRSKEGPVVHFAGDTALTLDMQLLAGENIDLAVLPIGDNFTMGPDDALKAVEFIKPKAVVPCHYNTWPFIEQDPAKFKADVEAKTSAKVHVLEPGAAVEL